MEETQKFLAKMKEVEQQEKSKPEMVRRQRLVKWVRLRAETFEMMMRTNPDPMFMEGMAYVINRLCEDFDIDGVEMQQ